MTSVTLFRPAWLAMVLALSACAHGPRSVSPDSQPCTFSGAPRSSLAWQTGPGSFTIHGRVVGLPGGAALPSVGVRLNAGRLITSTDKSGFFEFPRLPAGRYLLEVLPLGRIPAADSVTVGDNGLEVVAVVASYTGDIVCIRPASVR